MPVYRAFFPDADSASTGLARGIASLEASYLAASKLALPTTDQALASGAPTTNIKVLSVTEIANNFVRAFVECKSQDGRTARTNFQMLAADLPDLPRVGGYLAVPSAAGTLATFKGRIATSMQYQTTGAATATGEIVQDRITGKKYVCGTSAPVAAGTYNVVLTQSDAGDSSDVTYGTKLFWLTPPVGVTSFGVVNQLLGSASLGAVTLTDGNGNTYVSETVSLPVSVYSLAGNLTNNIVVSHTDGPDLSSLTEGQALRVVGDSWPTLAKTAIVESVSRPTLASGTAMLREFTTPGHREFVTTAVATVNDTGYAIVPFVASFDGPAKPSQLAAGDFLIFDSVPDGFTNGPPNNTVTSVVDSQAYPQPLASEVVGEALTWNGFIQRESDGRYSVNVYSVPIGA